jgi:ribosome-binding protein aMBF1 (putative translation factor)
MHKPNTITIEKKRYVLIPEAEYKILVAGAPPLPPKLPDGNYPALEAIGATIAQSIVRDRLSVGMSQKELAQAAGIRPEVLNRAERGVNVPNLRTLGKIENALARAGVKRNPKPKA